MSPQRNTECHPEFCPRESLPMGMQVSQAWLPVQVLSDVIVEVEERQRITLIERFAIETLLTLKNVSPKDLFEIASIPPELGRWLLNSLAQKGLATSDSGTCVSVPDRCRLALTTESLPSIREKRLDCLWFPLTNEVVVQENAQPILKALRSIKPSASYPLDGAFAGKPLTDVLGAALSSGHVYSDTDNRVCGLRSDIVLRETVPAYQAAADVSPDACGTWRVTLIGNRRKKHREGDEPERSEVLLAVPRLVSLAERWQHEYQTAKHAALAWLRSEFGVEARIAEDGCAVIVVSQAFVRQFAEHELMSDAMKVRVCLDREFACDVPVHLEAGDAHAQSQIDLDSVIRQYLASPATSGTASESDFASIIERMWQLRLFKPLYDLRARGDFAV